MAETYGFAKEVLKEAVGVDLDYRRMSRSSDQSFWGHGIPTVLACLSEQSIEDSEMFKAMASLLGGGAKGGGLGWWWHTTEDTLDKIDSEFLVRDARVYAEAMWRICTRTTTAARHRRTGGRDRQRREGLSRRARGSIDLSGTIEMAADLARAKFALSDLSQVSPERANRLLMDLDRHTPSGEFHRQRPVRAGSGARYGSGARTAGGRSAGRHESGERRFQISSRPSWCASATGSSTRCVWQAGRSTSSRPEPRHRLAPPYRHRGVKPRQVHASDRVDAPVLEARPTSDGGSAGRT